jgi:DNA-binding NarL/FixJ family response regulator
MAMAGEDDAARLRVVLVEDEDLYRDLLRGCLEAEPGLEAVGSFGSGPAALAAAPALRPDVAVLDVQLGHGPDGIRVGLELRRRLPGLGIVVLSHHRDARFAAALSRPAGSGAPLAGWSYLLKASVRERTVLVRAVRGAVRGEVVLDPLVVAAGRPREGSPLGRLAPRQRQILELVAAGLTNGAIAARLFLAEKSVENQLTVVYEHLGLDRRDGAVHPRVQAVLAYLRESRWASPDASDGTGRAPAPGPGAPGSRAAPPAGATVGATPLSAAPGLPYAGGGRAEGAVSDESTGGTGAGAAGAAAAGRRDGDAYRVFLVDDQPAFLAAARALLGAEPRLTVVGEATSGPEAVARLPGAGADVALLDVQMPGLTGFETAQALRALAPALRIVLTSTVDDRAYAATAARLGAAFLPKGRLSPRALLALLQPAGGA